MARNDRIRTGQLVRLSLISVAVSSCFASGTAIANPTGANVVRGTVAIHQAGNLLQITNSPNAIINWQSFSIGANEITRFLQESSSSAVLNRVTTQNPSSILGALQSNGRVFLINPNGILFGSGAQIDVGGLVASTLRMSDEDFLAGRMRFGDGLGNSLINQGSITTPAGGHVYLVGPAVTNSGVITSPQGEVVLAAGNTVELVNPGTPNLRVEITAPDNQALNLGQIFADSGRVGIYGGLINQSGVIQANTAVATEDGRIVLKATNSATLGPGSVTTATGPLEIEAGGNVTVSGNVTSGPQTITAGGGLIVEGGTTSPAQLVASGGQTINAGFVEVTAQDAPAIISNTFSGDQVITTTGMNAAGEGLAVRSLGGLNAFAQISQSAAGQSQVIDVSGADKVTVNGAGSSALISANFFNSQGQGQGLAQTLSVTGAGANAMHVGSPGGVGASLVLGGSQNITAGANGQSGSITIVGPATNNQLAGLGSDGPQSISTSGILSVTGGSAPAQPLNFSGLVAHNGAGQQTVNAFGITLQGGSSGSRNNAQIAANTGSQQITVGAGGITLTGGSGGVNNFAQIRQNDPALSQTITVTDGGNVVLQGGAGGTDNAARIFGANQLITAAGNVTLNGGPGSGNGPIIGSVSGVAHNLVLTAGGDVVLTGGSAASTGALIGNTGTAPLQPTNIAINAGGDVILNGGTGTAGAAARIGSSTGAPAAGGDISISAGESIQLNSSTAPARIRTLGNVTLLAGSTISEGPNGFIEASTLTTTSNAGTGLTGPNQVASFNAVNTTTGDVVFNNTSPLLTVSGVSQIPFGTLRVNQAGDLTLTGTIMSGPQAFNATGNILVVPSSPAFVSASGPQTINAGGGLIVQSNAAGPAQLQASGGQAINAGFIEVTAAGGEASITNWGSGDQIITTTGMNLAGEGLAVRNLGELASAGIAQNAPGQAQFINISNADKVTIDGAGPSASIFANGGLQTLSVTGTGANAINIGSSGALGASIFVGGSQNIIAGTGNESGSITIIGPGANSSLAGFVSNGQQSVRTSGMISVTGGTAPAQPTNFPSGILHNGTGQQDVSAAGIMQQGGPSGSGNVANISAHTGSQRITVGAGGITLAGGTGGTRNSAFLGALNGTQHVTVGAGGIAITGGSGGSNNIAQIQQTLPSGNQTITVDGGGIALQGGPSGTNNGAFLFGANQLISATGNVTLNGGSDSGNSSIIGSLSGVPTNLVLTAGGDVVLTGGSAVSTGANIGSSGAAPLQPTHIAINAGGDVILTGGTGAGARIGSSINAPAAGGDISISAGESIQLNGTAQAARIRTLGNVTLNAGGMISEGPNGLVEANALTATSSTGSSLTGPNQVASFNATNTAAGDIALVNSGNLAVMAFNAAPGGKITVNNLAGDLSTSGSIAASGGGAADVALAAGGAVNIAHPVTASGTGNISLAGGAITVDDTSVTAGGSVTVNGASLDVKGVSSGALIEAGNGFDASLSGDLRVRAASTGGGLGGWSAILADNGPVNILAGNVALEGGSNLGSFSTIAGESVAISTTGDLSIAGGTGLAAFGLLSSYRDINLTVGGTVRLDSGSGLGSFARVQTLYPGSTINVDFPNLGSGGYSVNDVEGRISQGLTGFFNGIRPARPGRSLVVTYGE